jgi:hypothetical protein
MSRKRREGIRVLGSLTRRIDPSRTLPFSRTIPNRSARRCSTHRWKLVAGRTAEEEEGATGDDDDGDGASSPALAGQLAPYEPSSPGAEPNGAYLPPCWPHELAPPHGPIPIPGTGAVADSAVAVPPLRAVEARGLEEEDDDETRCWGPIHVELYGPDTSSHPAVSHRQKSTSRDSRRNRAIRSRGSRKAASRAESTTTPTLIASLSVPALTAATVWFLPALSVDAGDGGCAAACRYWRVVAAVSSSSATADGTTGVLLVLVSSRALLNGVVVSKNTNEVPSPRRI